MCLQFPVVPWQCYRFSRNILVVIEKLGTPILHSTGAGGREKQAVRLYATTVHVSLAHVLLTCRDGGAVRISGADWLWLLPVAVAEPPL